MHHGVHFAYHVLDDGGVSSLALDIHSSIAAGFLVWIELDASQGHYTLISACSLYSERLSFGSLISRYTIMFAESCLRELIT